MKKLNICNIPLSESEEYDIWWILSMYSLLRVSLYNFWIISRIQVSTFYLLNEIIKLIFFSAFLITIHSIYILAHQWFFNIKVRYVFISYLAFKCVNARQFTLIWILINVLKSGYVPKRTMNINIEYNNCFKNEIMIIWNIIYSLQEKKIIQKSWI